jgi:molecular chaperone GrpE
MTSARRPAGAPDEERRPAGAPEERVGDERGANAERPRDDAKLADSPPNAPSAAEDVAALEGDFDALLADVKRERDEYLELAQRARADFENYRKRAAREARDAERRGKASLARELVPALDNLERALRSAGIDPDSGLAATDASRSGVDDQAVAARAEEEDAEAFDLPSEEVSAQEALARGVALVYGELRAALERAGVETYDPTGDRFDPAEHEALSTRPGDDGVAAGTVLETVEKGYRLDGQVLRAARVVVSE